MRLLLDENLSPNQAVVLREAGHDAISVVEVGLAGSSDETVRAYAIETGRVLLTLDADFANMVRFPPTGTPGVIRLKIHPPTEEAIQEQIHRTLTSLSSTTLEGCLAVSHGAIVRIRRGTPH